MKATAGARVEQVGSVLEGVDGLDHDADAVRGACSAAQRTFSRGELELGRALDLGRARDADQGVQALAPDPLRELERDRHVLAKALRPGRGRSAARGRPRPCRRRRS